VLIFIYRCNDISGKINRIWRIAFTIQVKLPLFKVGFVEARQSSYPEVVGMIDHQRKVNAVVQPGFIGRESFGNQFAFSVKAHPVQASAFCGNPQVS
jgi:hypothetical protein